MATVGPASVTLAQYTAAVVAGIETKFGAALKSVRTYEPDFDPENPEARTQPEFPYASVEVMEIDTDENDDPMTEQQAQRLAVRVRFIADGFEPGAKALVRDLSSSMLYLLKNQRWGLRIGPAEDSRAGKDDYTPELEDCAVWAVDFRQLIYVGESVFELPPGAEHPNEVWLGIAPEIGPPNIEDYDRIVPEE